MTTLPETTHDQPLANAGRPVPAEMPDMVLEQAWFDAPASPPSRRTPSAPPVVNVGEFLGDPLADAWLR